MPTVMKDLQTLVFFKSEHKDTKKRVEEKGHQKRKRPETGHVSRLCRFCKMQLKRVSNSPHIHMCGCHTHTYTCVVLTQAFLA